MRISAVLPRTRRGVLLWLLAAVLLGFGCLVWPTPWAYYDGPHWSWRRHRWSGDMERLAVDGWTPIK